MNTGFLEMFHDGTHQHLFAVGGRVDVNFRGVAEVLVHQKRFVRCEVGLSQVAVKLLLIGQDFHAASTQNIGRADEHGEPDRFHGCPKVVCRGPGRTARHPEVMAASKRLKPLSVACFVNGVARRAHDGQVKPAHGEVRKTFFERQGEIDGGLTTELEQDSVGLLTK